MMAIEWRVLAIVLADPGARRVRYTKIGFRSLENEFDNASSLCGRRAISALVLIVEFIIDVR
jgi:hypothetical protein